MVEYMTVNHPDAFKDIPKKQQVSVNSKECPSCKGHGSYNLRLDSYGPGKHFQGSCANCNGHGYVDDDSHTHEWVLIENMGTQKTYQCKHCHKIWYVDSSG